MSIVSTSDFTERYKIAQNRFSDLSNFIARVEKHYLIKLLGAELYTLFIADLTLVTPQTPQSLRFENIFNPFLIDHSNCIYESEGIRVMLNQFIYYEYQLESQYNSTIAGAVKQKMENSEKLGYSGYNLIDAYNEGVDNFRNIQWYIREYDELYPEENMQVIGYMSGI